MKLAQDDWTSGIAGEVRAWMARRQRPGRAVAAELGWSEFYLSRRLTGAVPFSVAELAMIAELLEVPVTKFFQIEPELRRAPILLADFPDPAADVVCSGCRDEDHCEGQVFWCCCHCTFDDDLAQGSVNLYRSGLGLAA